MGANSTLNVEKKLRLQLFYPFKQFSNCPDDLTNDTTDGVEMMNWFVKMRRVKYPGTIYVTVKGTRVSAAAGQAVNKMIGRMTEVWLNSISLPGYALLPLHVFTELFFFLGGGGGGVSLRVFTDLFDLICSHIPAGFCAWNLYASNNYRQYLTILYRSLSWTLLLKVIIVGIFMCCLWNFRRLPIQVFFHWR